MKPGKVMHYSGGVQTSRGEWLSGWPCCCSGDKAEAIEAHGNQTSRHDDVTCAACRRRMKAAQAYEDAKMNERLP